MCKGALIIGRDNRLTYSLTSSRGRLLTDCPPIVTVSKELLHVYFHCTYIFLNQSSSKLCILRADTWVDAETMRPYPNAIAIRPHIGMTPVVVELMLSLGTRFTVYSWQTWRVSSEAWGVKVLLVTRNSELVTSPVSIKYDIELLRRCSDCNTTLSETYKWSTMAAYLQFLHTIFTKRSNTALADQR